MSDRGHQTEVWQPIAILFRLPVNQFIKKWLGYLDAFILFPLIVKYRLRNNQNHTLFVLTDQALGPWLPLIVKKAHVVHCHDFLALQSAHGQYKENPTGWSGKLYQKYILNGYRRGKDFISVSQATRERLKHYVSVPNSNNKIVYNGLNTRFQPLDVDLARKWIQEQTQVSTQDGYIVHVGGNQWYKNRSGVIRIYNAWRSTSKMHLPLLLIGEEPTGEILDLAEGSPYKGDIHFLTGKSDEFIHYAYAGARVLLYPSIAEGFGWPIAEAMSCGCPVVTTGLAPMTEVGGSAAFYIKRSPTREEEKEGWAIASALVLARAINLTGEKKHALQTAGFKQTQKFSAANALDQIEKIYLGILFRAYNENTTRN